MPHVRESSTLEAMNCPGCRTAEKWVLVGQHHVRGSDSGTAHLAIDSVAEGVGAVLMGHDYDLAVAGHGNLGTGILAVGAVVLELGVASGLAAHDFAVFCLQNNKKRRKKQLGEARKQVAEGATL